jgi:hypothetical protein
MTCYITDRITNKIFYYFFMVVQLKRRKHNIGMWLYGDGDGEFVVLCCQNQIDANR